MSDGVFSLAVVVPNRNDARYLRRCLDSLLRQRQLPDEIIFVDDQSTDESVSLARALLSEYSIARIVENPTRLGTNGAINVGLRLARSRYVFFLSSNDYISPELFARAALCLGAFPSAGVWSAMTWTIDERCGRRLYPSAVIARKDSFFAADTCCRLAYEIGSWFMTPMFDREALLEIGGFDASLQGLSDLFAALVLAGRRGAAFSPAPLGIWQLHEDSLLSRTCSDQEYGAAVRRFQQRGQQLAPDLFTPGMVARTELRLYFASLRWSQGSALPYVTSHLGKGRRAAMNALATLVPRRFQRLRLGLMFAVMRPFDLIPTIRYRLLGSLIVRLRELKHKRAERESAAVH